MLCVPQKKSYVETYPEKVGLWEMIRTWGGALKCHFFLFLCLRALSTATKVWSSWMPWSLKCQVIAPKRDENWWVSNPVSSSIDETMLKSFNIVSQKIPKGSEPQLSMLLTHSVMLFIGSLISPQFPHTFSCALWVRLPIQINVFISLPDHLILGKPKLRKILFNHWQTYVFFRTRS